MTKPHLVACPSCARHVRTTEAACPFCRAALPDALRSRPAPEAPRARLSRAALFALGTGAAALTPACSSSSTPNGAPGVEVDGGSTDAGDRVFPPRDDGSVVAPYGSSPIPTAPQESDDAGARGDDAGASADAGAGAGDDGGHAAQPLYGAPAHHDDGGSVTALYGAAPGGN